MPPRGYKKGYVKDPKTGEYGPPKDIVEKLTKPKEKKPAKVKDELGPTTKPTEDTSQHATVVVTWKDQRGRDRSTQYVMAELNLSESINETFENAKKKTRIHLTIDGMVLDKV